MQIIQVALATCIFAAALFCGSSVFAQTATDTASTTEPVVPVVQQMRTPYASDVYRVTQLEGDQDYGDFVVGPGKFDLSLAPGQSEVVEVMVTNRTGTVKEFSFTAEDMAGSSNLEMPTVLLGDDRGPYTIKDFLVVPYENFLIEPGQRVSVPVTVTMPADAEPGGRYGALLVQTASQRDDSASRGASTAVVSRIAVLFFVSTPGELDRSGSFVDFTTVPDTFYFSEGPIDFGILYENTGTVHTNPAGEISITNMFGQSVGYIEVLPWSTLPQSLRLREVTWERETLLGRYTAEARVYLGYDDIIETKTLTFWVVDWKLLLTLTLVVVLLFLFVRYIARNFTFTRRTS